MVDDERPETGPRDGEPSPDPAEQGDLRELRDHVPAEIRDVSFPTAVRGYDRRAVDTYVKRVNRLIAELEVSRSPQAAVRHALDRVGAQTSGILQQARETAEEITSGAEAEAEATIASAKAEAEKINASARTEADETTAGAEAKARETTARAKAEEDEILARSRAEAAERLQRVEGEIEALREQSDTRMRKLGSDTEAIREERGELVDEIRQLAGRLEEIASGAAARFPHRNRSELEGKGMPPEGEAETDPAEIAAANDPSGGGPEAAPNGDADDEPADAESRRR